MTRLQKERYQSRCELIESDEKSNDKKRYNFRTLSKFALGSLTKILLLVLKSHLSLSK